MWTCKPIVGVYCGSLMCEPIVRAYCSSLFDGSFSWGAIVFSSLFEVSIAFEFELLVRLSIAPSAESKWFLLFFLWSTSAAFSASFFNFYFSFLSPDPSRFVMLFLQRSFRARWFVTVQGTNIPSATTTTRRNTLYELSDRIVGVLFILTYWSRCTTL